MAVVVAILAYLALVPIGFLLWKTFVVDGALTLDSFREAYSAIGLGEMALNSFLFALGTTPIAVGIGTSLAYLVLRTDLPGRRVVGALTLVQLLVPGVLYTVSWIFLASPRTGLLNRALEPVAGAGAIDIFGLGGMVLVEGLHLVPIVFLLMGAAFATVDPTLEESALTSGARLSSVVRRVSLPLVRPALFACVLIVVIRALEAFEVPALLGIPGGVWVFTSRIWRELNAYPADLDRLAPTRCPSSPSQQSGCSCSPGWRRGDGGSRRSQAEEGCSRGAPTLAAGAGPRRQSSSRTLPSLSSCRSSCSSTRLRSPSTRRRLPRR